MFPRLGIGSVILSLTLSPLLGSCGAGPYGFARTYAPASGEVLAAEGAEEYDPVMAGRQFHKWIGKKVSVFGVVKNRDKTKGNRADLLLSIRTRQARNLCETSSEDTCRVTVTDQEFGQVHANVVLSSGDDLGELSVGPGSLVRIVGTVTKEVHSRTGATVLDATFYRHWPSGYFVTTRDRQFMLR